MECIALTRYLLIQKYSMPNTGDRLKLVVIANPQSQYWVIKGILILSHHWDCIVPSPNPPSLLPPNSNLMKLLAMSVFELINSYHLNVWYWMWLPSLLYPQSDFREMLRDENLQQHSLLAYCTATKRPFHWPSWVPSRSIIFPFTVSMINQVDLPLRYKTGCLCIWDAREIFFVLFYVFNFQVSHEKVQKNLSSGLSNGRSLSEILITAFIHGLKRMLWKIVLPLSLQWKKAIVYFITRIYLHCGIDKGSCQIQGLGWNLL